MHSDDDSDIARLYAQFGGDPAGYQEIATLAAASQARARWPMLSAIDPLRPVEAPAVGADDAAVLAEAARPAAEAADAATERARPRPQFIPPNPKPFSREVPRAFVIPQAPELTARMPAGESAAEFAANEHMAAPADTQGAGAQPHAAHAPATSTGITPPPMPSAGNATPATAAGAQPNPLRRLVEGAPSEPASPGLPDLFKRLLSS
ncbi:Cellulose biosynthesis protein BcsR [Bordetella sputigena]|uniref:cellulose biosynthesis protein BcsP n=1 Tax=Bordetella sputigena TaxID=1416810 RepID=UPI0039F086F4